MAVSGKTKGAGPVRDDGGPRPRARRRPHEESREWRRNPDPKPKSNFVRDIIDEHLRTGRFATVHTRFPPEPNGYLHIGHAKSIHLNFGLARDYKGLCNLRMDDTNPETEDMEYVDAIKEDVRWLGFDWEDREFYASDYYEQLYDFAVVLIKKGVAYVCDLTVDQVREYRGTVNKAGRPSPYRDRSVEENLDLFARMRRRRVPRRLEDPAGQDRHGLAEHAPPRPPHVPHPARAPLPHAATPGASTRPTTGPTARATPSRASPIPSAPSSSRSTGRSTTGSSTSSASTIPSRSSSPGST